MTFVTNNGDMLLNFIDVKTNDYPSCTNMNSMIVTKVLTKLKFTTWSNTNYAENFETVASLLLSSPLNLTSSI